MKILHVHNMMIRNNGVIKFYTGKKFSNGIIRNNHTLLEFSDRDLCRYNSPLYLRHMGKKLLQKQLLDTCSNFQPDMILLGHCELISNQTLVKIREIVPHIKIAHWFLDALWIENNVERLKSRMHSTDAIFLTTAGDALKTLQTNHNIISFIPNPTDPSEEPFNNASKTDFSHDLLFCGLGRKSDYRASFIQELDASLKQTLRFKKVGSVGDAPVWGEAYKQILAKSKMALNLNGEEDWPLYSSDRIAQLMGNGILTFLWNKGEMKRLISENHAVYFDTQEELFEKIIHFHTHDEERKKIAAAGYTHYTTHFSAEHIIQYMIETTFKLPLTRDYLWQDETYA